MSDGWVTEPHPVDPVIAAAVDKVSGLLPALSDNPDRVLRASEIIPNTWEALVGRLTAGERRELFGVMGP
jgi:hypothetical protein